MCLWKLRCGDVGRVLGTLDTTHTHMLRMLLHFVVACERAVVPAGTSESVQVGTSESVMEMESACVLLASGTKECI